ASQYGSSAAARNVCPTFRRVAGAAAWVGALAAPGGLVGAGRAAAGTPAAGAAGWQASVPTAVAASNKRRASSITLKIALPVRLRRRATVAAQQTAPRGKAVALSTTVAPRHQA